MQCLSRKQICYLLRSGWEQTSQYNCIFFAWTRIRFVGVNKTSNARLAFRYIRHLLMSSNNYSKNMPFLVRNATFSHSGFRNLVCGFARSQVLIRCLRVCPLFVIANRFELACESKATDSIVTKSVLV